ncbi:MAG TPA: RNA polymerase sigma factor [Pirellulales bacterium]|jgi:RNA polymerase sigma-70 factor (ECF subfamily)|nr:RNA polymerase sigma factor [Pirellulales bacterium]
MSEPDRIARERQLRGAILRGDELAWRTWYDESFGDLLAYVAWRCGGRRDPVDEIVQETWLTAVRGIRSFDPQQASFAGWLRGVAANLIRNHVRQTVRRRQAGEPLAAEPAAASDDENERQAERAAWIAAALVALPPRYEAVLRAKYLDGLSVAAIASQSGESTKTIESLLTRAREAFRRLYLDAADEVANEKDV